MLVVLLCLALLLAGCEGIRGNSEAGSPASSPSPPTPPAPPASGGPFSCPPAPKPAAYSSQILLAADIQDDNSHLWAYKIDEQTGALREMPWSPLQTFAAPRAGTADFNGQFLYLFEEGVSSGNLGGIEVYRLGAQDDAPTVVQRIPLVIGYGLTLDPSGAHLYGLESRFLGPNPIHTYARACDGTLQEVPPPAEVPAIANSFGFKATANGEFALVAREEREDSAANSVHVFRRDPASGTLTEVSSASFRDVAVRFLAVPENGRFFLGTKVSGGIPGTSNAQVFSFDASRSTVSPLADGAYPGIVWAFFDRTGNYVATIELQAPVPPQTLSVPRALGLYRLDQNTGKLTQTDRLVLESDDPNDRITKLAFDLNNRYLYASIISIPNKIHGFAFDQATGKLSPVPVSPFSAPRPFSPMFVIGRP